MEQLKQVILAPDGTQFETMAEAKTYLRRPKIKEALLKLTKYDEKVAAWLLDNQETVENAFETGVIRRVSKSERNKLEKALNAIVEAANPKFAFVAENADTIKEVFRWPTIKRLTPEEKDGAIRRTLMNATENEEAFVQWIIDRKEEILECYKAGIEKREVNPKAASALAAYRERKAAEKAAAEAAGKAA